MRTDESVSEPVSRPKLKLYKKRKEKLLEKYCIKYTYFQERLTSEMASGILASGTAEALRQARQVRAHSLKQCFGSGSGWIRIIWPDPDPLQEKLIWIRVAKKNRDKLAYK